MTLTDIRARARLIPGFALTGRKISVWDAPSAHYLIVSAAVDGGQSLSLFLVARDAPGLTRHDYRLIDGTQCADIDMQSVAATLLLSGRQAAERLDEAADRLALVRSAEALGIMEQVLDLTADYLRNRSQFGQPLARFQALQHRLAEMFVEVQEVRSVLYRRSRLYRKRPRLPARPRFPPRRWSRTRQAVWWRTRYPIARRRRNDG